MYAYIQCMCVIHVSALIHAYIRYEKHTRTIRNAYAPRPCSQDVVVVETLRQNSRAGALQGAGVAGEAAGIQIPGKYVLPQLMTTRLFL